jgi:hypothetical protein
MSGSRAIAFACLVLAASSAAAQELGRLFMTPEQRASLDARRKARVPDRPAEKVVASPTTRVDGYVQRSGGRSTVWVNGEPLSEYSAEAPRIRGGRTAQVEVPLGENGDRVRVKPGQVLNRETGEVRDMLGGGEVNIRPRGKAQ